MLSVKNLSCGYGDEPVVKNISFDVKDNEGLCIIGPNGCGKTTLLRAVAGMLEHNGEISVDETDIKTLTKKQVAKKIALMSQISSIYFSYTVFETVMLGRYAYQKRSVFSSESQEDKDIVLECLKKTGMLDLKDRLITELSGGQLQRVFLARAFAQSPQIILLDEPTNHLDLKYQIELVQYLREWTTETNRCIVGVFHDINLALSFADSLLLMQDGVLAEHAKVEDFDLDSIGKIYDTDIRKYMQSVLKRWQ